MLGSFHHGIIASGFVAASSGSWKVASGTYLGTGASLGITGLGFTPQLIIIKASGSTANDDPVIAWSGMSDSVGSTPSAAVISPSTAPATGIITSYDSGGFTVANNVLVNTSGMQYYWAAIAGSSSELALGNYIGNGVDNRDVISGLTFQPTAVFIRRRNLNTVFVNYKISSMTGDTTYQLGNAAASTANMIQQFNPDGVQVGTANGVNSAAASFDWIAFAPPTNYGTMGSYIGDGSDNRDVVSGLTFQPEFVLIKGNTLTEAILRTTAHSGDQSSALQNSVANAANRIQAINADGFQVGTNAAVNSSTTVYHYMALKTT